MSFSIRILVVLAVLVGARAASAQAQETPEAMAADCRQVVAGFMTALEAGDADALRLYIHTDRRVTAQEMGRGALIDCIVSQRELERTMTTKWGTSAATRMAGPVVFSAEDRQSVAKAQVEWEGDNEALLVLSSSVSPVVLHRNRFDRRWRVRLGVISGLYDGFEHSPSPSSFKRITHLRTVANALQFATRQVQEGKLTNPSLTRAAVQRAIEMAIHAGRARYEGRMGDR